MADTARKSRHRPRPAVGGGRTLGRPTTRRRRRDVRQDDHAGVWLQGRDKFTAHGHQPQSLGSHEDAGRLIRWHRGGRRRRPWRIEHGHGRSRECAHPGGVLRQRRYEGEFRPSPGVPALALRDRGPRRAAHNERDRLCTPDERRGAARSTRLDVAAIRRRRLPRRPRHRYPRPARRLLAHTRLRRRGSRGSGSRRRGGAPDRRTFSPPLRAPSARRP